MKKTPTIKFVWRKFILSALITAPLATLPSPLWALPGNQTQLNAQISAATPGITITSYSPTLVSVVAPADRGVVKWINFGNGTVIDPTGAAMTILAGDTISYTLPSATSSILNTVLGPGGVPVQTNIAGTITSNGIVNILNPAGIVVGSTAIINTAGLVLSTIPEAEYTFQATGSLGYTGYPSAGVQVNGGTINVNAAGSTGSVYLAGNSVDVSGTITAGTLNVNAKAAASGGTSGNVRLAVTGPLTLGTAATTPDALGNYTPGYGNLTVNTAGGSVDVAFNGGTSVYGGTATINTGNGIVQQTALAKGSVTSVPVTTSGTLYTVAPIVTLGAPAAGGLQATAVPVMDGAGNIASIAVTYAGSGYAAAPTVTITGGTTTGTALGAGATAPISTPTYPVFLVGDGQSASTTTINAGTGAVTLKNVTGNGKAFQTGIVGGVTSITGYGDITLKASTITGTNPAVDALTILSQNNTVSGITASTAGTGYTVAPTISLSAPNILGGTQATATLFAKADGTLTLTVTNAGSGYTAAPTVTITSAGTTSGTAVAFNATSAAVGGAGSIGGGAGTGAVTNGTINLTANGADKSITFSGPSDLTFSTLSSNNTTKNTITLTSTTGSVVLGNTTSSGQITVTAANNISQTSGTAITNDGNSGVKTDKGGNMATFDAQAGSLTLDQGGSTGNNKLVGITIKDAPGGATIINKDNTDNMLIGAGTATGVVTITNNSKNVQLGRSTNTAADSAGDAVKFNSTLTINSATVTDTTDKAYVFGALTLNTTGAITLNGAFENTTILSGLSSQYGQINITGTATNATLFEQTTLNLGAITLSGTLNALSTAGNITNTGQLKIAGALTLGAGIAAAPGNINLDFTAAPGAGNRLGGTINFYDDVKANGGTGYTGTYLANNVTIVNELSTVVNQVKNTLGTGGIAGNLTITSGYAGAGLDTVTGVTLVANSGGLSYATAPTVTFSAPTGSGGRLATGTATLSNGVVTGISITDSGSGYITAPTVTFSAGTFYGTGTAATTAGASAPTVALAGPSVYFGVKGDQQVNIGGKVNLTATDTILATSGSTLIGGNTVTATAGGNVNFAASGAFTVNGTMTQLAAGKTALFTSGQALTIGTYTSNYSGLTTFASGNKQTVGDSVAGIAIYGPVLFNSNGAVNITKTGHNFGGITIATGSNNQATVTESGTMKLVSVSTGTGNLTLSSSSGDIIQDTSALQAGIRIGDSNGANKATFSAVNGKVTLSDTNAQNNLPDVVLNVTAGSDVLIKDSKQTVTLGNITTSGKLTVDMTSAGTITGVTIPLGTGGADYLVNSTTTVPVTFSAPTTTGGVTATGNASVDATGAITGITITNNGSGYTAAPTLTGLAAPAAGTTATATVTTAGVVLNSINVTGAGSRYTTAPTTANGGIILTGGTATTPATATAILDATGAITGISLTNASVYTVAPTGVTIVAPVTPAAATFTGTTFAIAGIGAGIKQGTGTAINEYDTVTMKTINGYINVSNTGNKFGGAVLNVGNGAGLPGTGDIALTEFTTLNLKSVQTNTNFTAVSEGYDIISTTDGTITSNSLNVGGNTTLTASNGAINAYLAGSSLGYNYTSTNPYSVYLTSKGDASVLDTAAATLSLGSGSVVGGALTARNTYYYVNPVTLAITTGNITQNGPVKATGAVLFDASSGSISMSDPNNQFGGIRFMAGGTGATGGAKISELTTMNLTGGSISTGPVQLSTSGDFVTTAPGGTSVTNDLVINAGGKITPGAGSLTVTGTLTVISNSGIDLSKLSLSGNLLGKAPVVLGTGTYIPPAP